MKKVVALVGAGKHVVLGDLKLEAAQTAAKIFEGIGFETR